MTTIARPTATIRAYRPVDHRACRRLWAEYTVNHRELYDDQGYGGADPGAGFEEYLTRLNLSGLWVAEHPDDGVVAFVGLVLNGRAGEVEPIVVTERHRRHGLGRALLDKVGEEGRRRGLRQLSVRPSTRNLDAIRCCHSAGFTAMERVTLTLDLSTRGHEWRDGIDLHDRRFEY